MRVHIVHNIVWSKYKGAVFSAVSRLASCSNTSVSFCQIAETESDRVGLSSTDLSYHTYPFQLLFRGSYESVPKHVLVRALFKEAWNVRADMVVLPGYHRIEYWAMLAACILRGTPRAVFCDSTINDQRQRMWKGLGKRVFFKLCDGYFAYGDRARAYLLHYGASPARIFERCQAAALPHTYLQENALKSRLIHAPSPNAARYLYVGRLAPEKSLPTLVRAFAQVHRRSPHATLVLVGAGPARAELEKLVVELGLVNAVQFLGSMNTDQLSIEYARATCLVLPSMSEPWGLVVNEALAFGCPVLVSDRCGCLPELVNEQASGLSFVAGSEVDLAKQMLEATSRFSDIEAVAQHALRLISKFTPQAAAEAILIGCQAMLHERPLG